MQCLFPLGRTVATPGVLAALEANHQTPTEFLNRHVLGNWGDLDDLDYAANNRAVKDGERILSAYHLDDDTKIYIITEHDRSSTCILLVEDY